MDQERLLECIRRMRDADEKAMGEIYEHLRENLLRPIKRRCPTGVDPEDILSETFVRLCHGLHRLQDVTRFNGYALHLSRNVIAEEKRFRAHHVPMDLEAIPDDPDPQRIEREVMERAILSVLKGRHLSLFRSLYIEGATPSEIRSRLHLTPAAYRKRKSRMFARIRELLQCLLSWLW